MPTNKEILEKAINKAIEGGWKPLHDGTKPISDNLVTVTNIIKENPRMYVYSHDFAKAVWGEKQQVWVGAEGWVIDDEGNTNNSLSKAWIIDLWQYHLQQMVISDDPIKYIEENI